METTNICVFDVHPHRFFSVYLFHQTQFSETLTFFMCHFTCLSWYITELNVCPLDASTQPATLPRQKRTQSIDSTSDQSQSSSQYGLNMTAPDRVRRLSLEQSLSSREISPIAFVPGSSRRSRDSLMRDYFPPMQREHREYNSCLIPTYR